MTTDPKANRVERVARLRWIPISKMHVSALAQRELNKARVDRIAASIDVEEIGNPTVNERDGKFYIIDGQHRVEALRLIGWGDQQIQCWAYVGLSEGEEAEKFLKLNDKLAVAAFANFRIAVKAGRLIECDVDRVVRTQGLRVSQEKVDGAVSCVGTLVKVYKRGGPAILGRTLRIIRDAYGTPGLSGPVIDGIGLLCDRYNGELQDELAVTKLGKAFGGVTGLLNRAETIRERMGQMKSLSVAAAAVEILNSRPAGAKLTPWWREDAA